MKCPPDIPLNEDFHPNKSEARRQAILRFCCDNWDIYHVETMNAANIACATLEHIADRKHNAEDVRELCRCVLKGIQENTDFIRSCH